MSEYGNIDSSYYLYGAYLLTAVALALFVCVSARSRNRALQDLQTEGFLESNHQGAKTLDFKGESNGV
jgi:heme exporter protein D